MSGYKQDKNAIIFQKATKQLKLRFPIAEISKKTGYAKGGISDFLNGKKPVSDAFLEKFAEEFNVDLNAIEVIEEFVEPLESITGYYYPEVIAAAGLDKEVLNQELNRVPINIPNWGKGLIFINVFGDSMYPKYHSGEIIGIKEIEFQYINYGYAYVIVLNNGDTYIKIVQPGSDKEHLILESVNDFYKPKEFHLSLIKSFYSIKGVIKKEMM